MNARTKTALTIATLVAVVVALVAWTMIRSYQTDPAHVFDQLCAGKNGVVSGASTVMFSYVTPEQEPADVVDGQLVCVAKTYGQDWITHPGHPRREYIVLATGPMIEY